MVARDGLWAVWITRKRTRVIHTAHSPYDGGVSEEAVVPFSVINWLPFG